MVFMPGRRLRSASSQQVVEVTKYVGYAVASVVTGCGEANFISERRSNTIELQLHTTDLQQHYLFCAGHDLQIEHRFGAMIIEQQDVQHRIMREHAAANHGANHTAANLVRYGLHLNNILKLQ